MVRFNVELVGGSEQPQKMIAQICHYQYLFILFYFLASFSSFLWSSDQMLFWFDVSSSTLNPVAVESVFGEQALINQPFTTLAEKVHNKHFTTQA